MFLTAHAITAAVIVENLDIQSSVFAFVFGFLSHFILDAIPHGDEGLDEGKGFVRVLWTWALADGLVLTFMLLLLLPYAPWLLSIPVLAAMIGSIAPDALQAVHHLIFPIPRYMRLHNRCHEHFGKRIGIRYGLLLQGGLVALAIGLLMSTASA